MNTTISQKKLMVTEVFETLNDICKIWTEYWQIGFLLTEKAL